MSDQHAVPPPPPGDPNRDAVAAAGLDPANAAWLEGVADVVDARLDAVRRDWRDAADPEVARACGFGLLLGLLATRHPSSRPALERVAEAHPSFRTLPTGGRLATLERIVGDPGLTLSWVGPVLGVEDSEALAPLRG